MDNDNIINKLKADPSLEYWLRYAYIRMTNHPKNTIEEIVDHFHRSGYDDSKIYEIAAKWGHMRTTVYPQLMAA